MIRGQTKRFNNDNLEILLFDMFYRALMAKRCLKLNQRILKSAGRKRVNFGVFLKGEDNIPVFFLNSYAVMLQILVCLIYCYVTNVLLIKVKLESLNYNQDF